MSMSNNENKGNPLTENKEEQLQMPSDFYTEDEKTYLDYLQKRLQDAKRQKDASHVEFEGKNYYQDYEKNRDIANTKLKPKKNDDDVVVSAGTIESKLDSLLAHVHNLDLSPEAVAYDRDNNMLHSLAIGITDTIQMTEQIDGGDLSGDKEKKLLRQRELFSQNAVFVQEEWLRKFETKKKLKNEYRGQFRDVEWDEKLELVFEGPSRTILHGPNVYLGNITEFTMEKQPYVFVSIPQDYEVAKAKYGHFDNWKYVRKGPVKKMNGVSENNTIYDNKWNLESVKKNQVEVILYQDKPNDEFQIIINGMLMLPIGFPLSAATPGGEYNIAKQVFRPIANFAYGKPFVRLGSIQQLSDLLDEMLKLVVLKTRKSIAPPYVNVSGRVISRRVLSPGRISMGIPPDALQKIGEEGQGATASEYQILKELQDRIDKSTVSPQFAGQQGKSGMTATESVELHRNAKLTLGLAVAACEFLELKLAYLRLYNILNNWIKPTGTKLVVGEDGKKKYVNRYRNITTKTHLEGAGQGERQVIFTDEGGVPDAGVIREQEKREEKLTGIPTQKIYIEPKGMMAARVRWYFIIKPREKETSAFLKMVFREELADMIQLMNLGSIPNVQGLEEKFSRVWEEDNTKMFKKQEVGPDMSGASKAIAAQMSAGRPNMPGVPSLNNSQPVEATA